MPSPSRPIVEVCVKICGLSTEDALDAALDAGAERVGLVFFARSPRHLTLDRAAALAARARGRAAVVALTVDADDAALGDIVARVAPDMLQLHGREAPERARAVRARFGRPVVKALGVSTAADVAGAAAYAAHPGAVDEILFDAKPPKGAVLPGGNGVAFDWSLLAGSAGSAGPAGPAGLDLSVPFMLSGGLGPGNVGEALRVTRAPAVDVSSGVETAPGVKSPELIAAFVRAARGGMPDEDLQP